MPDPSELGELIAYLARTSRLAPAEATRVVNEVLAFMNETPEDFIRRRHLGLQSQGLSNSEIFLQIATELAQRRFRAPELQRAADPQNHLRLTRKAIAELSQRNACAASLVTSASATRRPFSWKDCIVSSIAATTRPGIACARNDKLSIYKSKGKVRDLERRCRRS